MSKTTKTDALLYLFRLSLVQFRVKIVVICFYYCIFLFTSLFFFFQSLVGTLIFVLLHSRSTVTCVSGTPPPVWDASHLDLKETQDSIRSEQNTTVVPLDSSRLILLYLMIISISLCVCRWLLGSKARWWRRALLWLAISLWEPKSISSGVCCPILPRSKRTSTSSWMRLSGWAMTCDLWPNCLAMLKEMSASDYKTMLLCHEVTLYPILIVGKFPKDQLPK